MSFKKAGEATKFKKVIYLLLATFLGMLIVFIFYAWFEIRYINSHLGVNNFYLQGEEHIFKILEYFCLLGGAIGGFVVGKIWWKIIYIDRKKDK